MDKDFDWFKWVGLFTIIAIIVSIFYIKKDDNKSIKTADINTTHRLDEHQNISHTQASGSEKSYDQKLDEATQAMIDTENEAKGKEKNPPVYPSLSIEQTRDFIQRVENLRAQDANINLDYLPDVAAQSRKYNALVEEAETIYGAVDIANKFKYCTSMASFAREIWSNKYSRSSTSQEFKERTQKMFLDSYNQAKKDCLAEVESK